MYSVVLMAAITAGSATQDTCFMHGWGHSSCYGCSGCSGCWGCHGCSGCSGCWGCHGCSGCFGCHGCYGGSYGGCIGPTCYGCFGCHGCSGCYGCQGCSGCYGCHGCSGCYGCQGCSGCYGCHGCSGCYGCHGCCGGVVITNTYPPVMPPAKKDTEMLPAPKDGKDQEQSRAKVVIDVPLQASLYIDGQLMANKSGKRTFVTPALQPGKTYFYDVKIVQVQNGQEQAQTTRVVLRPGQMVAATFSTPATPVAVAGPRP